MRHLLVPLPGPGPSVVLVGATQMSSRLASSSWAYRDMGSAQELPPAVGTVGDTGRSVVAAHSPGTAVGRLGTPAKGNSWMQTW